MGQQMSQMQPQQMMGQEMMGQQMSQMQPQQMMGQEMMGQQTIPDIQGLKNFSM